jgi:hypothetical protein
MQELEELTRTGAYNDKCTVALHRLANQHIVEFVACLYPLPIRLADEDKAARVALAQNSSPSSTGAIYGL